MRNYKRIKIEPNGLMVNKLYLKFLRTFEDDVELKKKLSPKEYNFYVQTQERKYMKNDNGEEVLIKWDDISSWTASGRMDKLKVSIKIKRVKNELKPVFDSKYYLITVLEKYCFNKGKLSSKASYKMAQAYLYITYAIIFILAILMFVEIMK
ncbi:MAG: hypothetical protein II309_07480 [Bacilli bacterium]|jgi:hypothetical protein|nr:hypothetical protein [Bacilli bacterium]